MPVLNSILVATKSRQMLKTKILEIERLDKTRRCAKLILVAIKSRQMLKKARS